MLTHRLDQRTAGRSPLVVLSDPLDAHREAACSDLLVDDDPRSVLVFAYTRRPRVVARRVDDPESLTVLSLGEATAAEDSPDLGEGIVVEQCAASNLTRVGVAVSDAIERRSADSLRVCLGSLTALLQYVDTETAFKFLHVTISRLDAADAVVHAHLDPDAVDEETVATLTSLFDSVLVRADGRWTVESA